jgi:hypothetical protein
MVESYSCDGRFQYKSKQFTLFFCGHCIKVMGLELCFSTGDMSTTLGYDSRLPSKRYQTINKLRSLSLRANYTHRVAAAFR